MNLTNEEILKINNSINIIIDGFKKVIGKLLKVVKEVWNQFKEFLIKEIIIRTKAKKKGKKYIHSYIKFSYLNLLQRCDNKCKT